MDNHLGYKFRVLGLAAIVALSVFFAAYWYGGQTSDEDIRAINIRTDFRGLLVCLAWSGERNGKFDVISYGEDINSEWLYTTVSAHCQDVLIFGFLKYDEKKERIVDDRDQPVRVIYFGNETPENHADLAKRYEAVAWALGRDGIDEEGGGRNVFLGLRRNGEWDNEIFNPPWWKFWER
jgi:hypothetical protein